VIDILSILGLIVGAGAIAAGQHFDGGHIDTLINFPALLIVFGGTLGAVMVQTPMKTFVRAIMMFPWIILPPRLDDSDHIARLAEYSKMMRTKGVLALENASADENHHVHRMAINALLEGYTPEDLRTYLESEVATKEFQDIRAAMVFESMGGYAPTIGILGAVIGLIEVMRHLANPAAIGQGIAVAFVATIYGVGLANLLFLPAASKLRSLVEKVIRHEEMLVEGWVAIARHEHPRILTDKLTTYIEKDPEGDKKEA